MALFRMPKRDPATIVDRFVLVLFFLSLTVVCDTIWSKSVKLDGLVGHAVSLVLAFAATRWFATGTPRIVVYAFAGVLCGLAWFLWAL